MARRFVGRERELSVLERAWDAPEGQLVLVWGRRRIGKSYLLQRFADGKPAVYHTAVERTSEAELAAFSEAARRVLKDMGRELVGSFRSWDEALSALAEAAATRPLLVILDEFPYLKEADPALPSVIQRFWDTKGRLSMLRLVLCGSAATVLHELASYRAPLYGRFTVQLQLHAMGYREAAAFHSGMSGRDLALMHGVVGGTPLYVAMWEPGAGLKENLLRLFGDASAPLVNEGELLLRTELPEAAGYFRLLAAVAGGRTKFSEVRDASGMDPTRGLDRLLRVRFLERSVPVTEDPNRTRLRLYRVADNFLAFWFRFIHPYRGEIDRGLGAGVVRSSILPRMDDHMGPVFEEMCRDYVREKVIEGALPEATRVGAWWSADGQVQIDVVALRAKEAVLAGEAKWARTVDRRALAGLEDKVLRVPGATRRTRLALFARESFRGLDPADALLVNAEDLYA